MADSTTQTADVQKLVGLKEVALLVPTTLSALAVTLDVGFFYSVDSSLFSLFGLTEHLTFALLMVPYAIALLIFTALLMTYIRPAGEDTPSGIRLVWWVDRILFVGLVAVGCWVFIRTGMYTPLGLAVFVGVVWRASVSGRFFSLLLGAAASAFMMALFIGTDMATIQMNTPDAEHIVRLESGEIRGVLLRSGERGVLVYDLKDKRPTMLKWSEVKSVTSVEPATNAWLAFLRLLFPSRQTTK